MKFALFVAAALALPEGLLELNDVCMKSPLARHRCNPGFACQTFKHGLLRGKCKATNGTWCYENRSCFKGLECKDEYCTPKTTTARPQSTQMEPEF